MNSDPASAPRLKMLTYRAWRRGIRETDLILGPFADAHLHDLSAAQIDVFEALLEESDQDIYDWYKGAPAPAAYESDLMVLIRAFRPSSGDLAGGA